MPTLLHNSCDLMQSIGGANRWCLHIVAYRMYQPALTFEMTGPAGLCMQEQMLRHPQKQTGALSGGLKGRYCAPGPRHRCLSDMTKMLAKNCSRWVYH